jgi:hypothetical protein
MPREQNLTHSVGFFTIALAELRRTIKFGILTIDDRAVLKPPPVDVSRNRDHQAGCQRPTTKTPRPTVGRGHVGPGG